MAQGLVLDPCSTFPRGGSTTARTGSHTTPWCTSDSASVRAMVQRGGARCARRKPGACMRPLITARCKPPSAHARTWLRASTPISSVWGAARRARCSGSANGAARETDTRGRLVAQAHNVARAPKHARALIIHLSMSEELWRAPGRGVRAGHEAMDSLAIARAGQGAARVWRQRKMAPHPSAPPYMGHSARSLYRARRQNDRGLHSQWLAALTITCARNAAAQLRRAPAQAPATSPPRCT